MEDIPHPLTAKRLKEVGANQFTGEGDGVYNINSTKGGNRQPYLNDYQKSSPGVFYADRNYIM